MSENTKSNTVVIFQKSGTDVLFLYRGAQQYIERKKVEIPQYDDSLQYLVEYPCRNAHHVYVQMITQLELTGKIFRTSTNEIHLRSISREQFLNAIEVLARRN